MIFMLQLEVLRFPHVGTYSTPCLLTVILRFTLHLESGIVFVC